MQCYGHYKSGTDKCRLCDFAPYCKTAGDPPALSRIDMGIIEQTIPDNHVIVSDCDEETRFSDGHWMELVRRILEIDDPKLRRIMRMKIQNPNISFSEIGRKFGVTKQAIDKYLRRVEQYFPEFIVILRNRPNFNRWRNGRKKQNLRYLPKNKSILPIEQLTLFEIDESTRR